MEWFAYNSEGLSSKLRNVLDKPFVVFVRAANRSVIIYAAIKENQKEKHIMK
jgi:hypothetical protein